MIFNFFRITNLYTGSSILKSILKVAICVKAFLDIYCYLGMIHKRSPLKGGGGDSKRWHKEARGGTVFWANTTLFLTLFKKFQFINNSSEIDFLQNVAQYSSRELFYLVWEIEMYGTNLCSNPLFILFPWQTNSD